VLGVRAVGDADGLGEKGVGDVGYERKRGAWTPGSRGERGEAGCAGRTTDLCQRNNVPTRKKNPIDFRHNPGKYFLGILTIKNFRVFMDRQRDG